MGVEAGSALLPDTEPCRPAPANALVQARAPRHGRSPAPRLCLCFPNALRSDGGHPPILWNGPPLAAPLRPPRPGRCPLHRGALPHAAPHPAGPASPSCPAPRQPPQLPQLPCPLPSHRAADACALPLPAGVICPPRDAVPHMPAAGGCPGAVDSTVLLDAGEGGTRLHEVGAVGCPPPRHVPPRPLPDPREAAEQCPLPPCLALHRRRGGVLWLPHRGDF
mmetsp:Transcript_6058/g.16878  ORF Transcript_6058/g.16878 Transcript_6058/m.16878 type:complete len:221 (+) Transcript_6058:536-1198(+)